MKGAFEWCKVETAIGKLERKGSLSAPLPALSPHFRSNICHRLVVYAFNNGRLESASVRTLAPNPMDSSPPIRKGRKL